MLRADHWRVGGLVVFIGLSFSAAALSRGDSAVPRLVLLAPGTPVVGGLPENWSDRVIRSVPRLSSGKVGTLPESAKNSATRFRTTILADVIQGVGGYRLRTIGVGNAVPFGERELVVTPKGPAEVRATLSTIERIVAQRAFDELARGRLVAATPTFALLRTPARLVVKGRHEEVDLYYGVFVDPDSGAIRTLNWATLPGKPHPPSRMTLLPTDDVFDCGLDVRVTRKVGPWSVAWSFAMASLPPGKSVPVPDDAALLIESNSTGTGDPAAVEETLRGLIATVKGR